MCRFFFIFSWSLTIVTIVRQDRSPLLRRQPSSHLSKSSLGRPGVSKYKDKETYTQKIPFAAAPMNYIMIRKPPAEPPWSRRLWGVHLPSPCRHIRQQVLMFTFVYRGVTLDLGWFHFLSFLWIAFIHKQNLLWRFGRNFVQGPSHCDESLTKPGWLLFSTDSCCDCLQLCFFVLSYISPPWKIQGPSFFDETHSSHDQ